jgi:cytidylate kinase
LIVAVDGPAGSGKSSVAKEVALRLGFHYLDTGAMYRAVAVAALRQGISLDDGEALAALAQGEVVDGCPAGCPVRFMYGAEDVLPSRVFFGDEELTTAIRTPEADAAVSPVSACPELRDVMLVCQRELGRDGDFIVEGRDIGTVVFPKAELKVFLTASVEERARRRYEQNIGRGLPGDYKTILEALKVRDEYDSTREVAPLMAAEDAIELDTTELSQTEVVDFIVTLAMSHMPPGSNSGRG